MDELDDLAAFGLAEVNEDRAAGEWDDPHAPEAVLTTAQAAELATWLLWPGADLAEPPGDMEDLARTILAWAPVVAAAVEQTDAEAALRTTERPPGGGIRHPEREYAFATRAAEAAVRAMRAAGGGA